MWAICFDSFGMWANAGHVSASNGLRIAESPSPCRVSLKTRATWSIRSYNPPSVLLGRWSCPETAPCLKSKGVELVSIFKSCDAKEAARTVGAGHARLQCYATVTATTRYHPWQPFCQSFWTEAHYLLSCRSRPVTAGLSGLCPVLFPTHGDSSEDWGAEWKNMLQGFARCEPLCFNIPISPSPNV